MRMGKKHPKHKDNPMKDKANFMNSDRCIFREISSEDVDLLYHQENEEIIRDALFLALPQSREQMRDRILENRSNPATLMFSVFEKESGTFIGQSGLVRIDYISRSAVFYIAILQPDLWGKKYGTEISQAVRDYALNELNLNRIQLHVNTENTAAVKIYSNIGYRIEGTLRQAMYHNGHYCDFYVMGILKSDIQDNFKS